MDRLVPEFVADSRCLLLPIDCGFAILDELKEKCPRQVIEVGCREQAAVGLAAGLAIGGFRPIVYSLAKFLIWRALEFIEQDIVMTGLPVKFVGYGAGSYFRALGRSHITGGKDAMLAEVIGLPVTDDVDTFMDSQGPIYLRIEG